jgi:hypothetical protein
LDIHREHLVLEIEYTFNPLEKISYKILGERSESKENFIYFQDLGTGTMTTGEISPLMIISSPPNNRESEQYQQMLYYFKAQNHIHLENRQLGYEVGQLCSKNKKGKLRPSGHKETTRTDGNIVKVRIVTIELLLCDYCGSAFEKFLIDMR